MNETDGVPKPSDIELEAADRVCRERKELDRMEYTDEVRPIRTNFTRAEWEKTINDAHGVLERSIYSVLSDWKHELENIQARHDDLLGGLIDACHQFSAAHGKCKDPECTDAIVDLQDWAEFDLAVLAAVTGGRLPEQGAHVRTLNSAQAILGQQGQGRG